MKNNIGVLIKISTNRPTDICWDLYGFVIYFVVYNRLLFMACLFVENKRYTCNWQFKPCMHGTKFDMSPTALTNWGQATHKCANNQTIFGSGKTLSPYGHKAIIWTNAGILLIGHLGTKFIEIVFLIQNLLSIKCIWRCRLRNGDHYVSA